MIRHAESEKNVKKLHSDARKVFPLTANGIEQAISVAKYLKFICNADILNDLILYTGNEERVKRTGLIISKILNIEQQIVKLTTIDVGDIRGLSNEEISSLYPELFELEHLYKQNKLNGYLIKYPNGTSLREFQAVVIKEFEDIISRHAGNIVLIAHQSIISSILNYYYFIPQKKDQFSYITLKYCSISKLVINSKNEVSVNMINFAPYEYYKIE